MVPKNRLYQMFRTSVNNYTSLFIFFYDQGWCICCGEGSGCSTHINNGEKNQSCVKYLCKRIRYVVDWFNRNVQVPFILWIWPLLLIPPYQIQSFTSIRGVVSMKGFVCEVIGSLICRTLSFVFDNKVDKCLNQMNI